MRGHTMLSLMLWVFESSEKQSLGDRIWNILTAAGTVIGAGGIASTVVIFYWKRITGFFRDLKNSREKEPHLYNLVPWNFIPSFAPTERKAVILLEAINRGALDAVGKEGTSASTRKRPIPLRRRIAEKINKALSPSLHPEKAQRVWTPAALEHLKETQRYFVSPACSFEESSRPRTDIDGIQALLRWIGESSDSGHTDHEADRFWVFASGRAGKTMFMNRLLLEMIGRGSAELDAETPKGEPLPVPMFAAAETLRPHLARIEELKKTDNVVFAFATVWLENRNISIPEHKKSEYANAFKSALQGGQILLLLDGVDELLHQDMVGFTKNLLELVKYWVASNTPGGRIVPTRRALYLDEVWTYEQMASSLDLRMPNGNPRAKIRETVKETVREVIGRHDQALREGTTDQDHHWLSQAGNFHLFLGSLTPQTSEHEIRKLAESQPYLFREIFRHAVHHIDADADLLQIRDRLFDLAVSDPTSPRDGAAVNVAQPNDRISERIGALGDITQKTIKGPAFRHAAMREYFLAGRIAREILDPAVRTDNTDELARFDRWDSAKRDAIISWFEAITLARVDRLRARLRRRPGGAQINPTMRRNLLDIMLTLDRTHSLDNLDLSGIPGDGIDLKKLDVRSCTFANAELRNAELSGALFTDCDFSGANLSAADALGARFESCTFDNAKVHELAIRDAKFIAATNVDQRKTLEELGAVDFRTRYRDEFGEAWPAFQKAALGTEYEKLEDNVYLPAIRDALKSWDATQPVYMVDLMAGGSYRRVTDLLDEFSNLHIVGIDRDPTKQARPQRLAWTVAELGGAKSNGSDTLGIDLRESLTKAFGDTAFPVQAIVGKKALHEIDRALQPALIERCAGALAPRGRLILFADVPGPVNPEQLDTDELANLHRQLSGLRDFLGGDPSPSEVRSALDGYSYDGSPTSQIGFVNTWIMLKDWVNQNRHEVANRYFASVAEIKEWAGPCLGEPVAFAEAPYRLNPLMFNELGIQSVLHHVALNGPESVSRDRRQLQEMMSESERLNVLIEFSQRHLADESPLGVALKADERPIILGNLNPALKPLDTGARAWSFAFNCSVLVFEKGQEVSPAP